MIGGARKRVLVVDDEAGVRESIRILLSSEYEVLFATNGTEALEIVERERPNLVLLDIIMPGMDGLEVCKRLKEHAATKDAPVLVMTAHDDLNRRIQAFDLGAADVVRKPFELSELVARVRTQISIRTMTNALQQQ
ncbi:MAG: response regulator, partial [Candidatus Binatia bacterium]